MAFKRPRERSPPSITLHFLPTKDYHDYSIGRKHATKKGTLTSLVCSKRLADCAAIPLTATSVLASTSAADSSVTKGSGLVTDTLMPLPF